MPTVLSKPLLTAPLRAEGFISPKQQCAGDVHEPKRLKTQSCNDATSGAKEVQITLAWHVKRVELANCFRRFSKRCRT